MLAKRPPATASGLERLPKRDPAGFGARLAKRPPAGFSTLKMLVIAGFCSPLFERFANNPVPLLPKRLEEDEDAADRFENKFDPDEIFPNKLLEATADVPMFANNPLEGAAAAAGVPVVAGFAPNNEELRKYKYDLISSVLKKEKAI